LTLFFIISVIAANTFLAYIIGIDELKEIITGKFSEHVGGFLAMIIFSGVFFFIFNWFREQVCLVVCPYGRMQGVLLDKHSIVVAYDHKRGEPRKKYSKIPEPGVGDCIDCHECVRVCPTGIDIRNGTQLECTNCTACIDACDHIMEKVNKPKGLIRYASEYTIRTGKKLKWTYRMVAYTGVLVVLVGIESFLLVTRTDIDVSVNRARGQIFTKMDDGRIGNLYSIKVVNKIREDLAITFKVMDAEVQMIGKQMVVPAGNLQDGEFFVIIPEEDLKKRKTDLILELYNGDKLVHKEPIIFIGPSNNQKH
jgi:cytochrome c oxidase accessory protein FixG